MNTRTIATTVAASIPCLTYVAMATLAVSGNIPIEMDFSPWFFYSVDILPTLLLIVLCIITSFVEFLKDSNLVTFALATSAWSPCMFTASASNVLPLIGILFTKSAPLGTLSGIILAISVALGVLIMVAGAILMTEEYPKYKDSPYVILFGAPIAVVTFITRTLIIHHGLLEDYFLIAALALYTFAILPHWLNALT